MIYSFRGIQLISLKTGSNESFYTYNAHGDVVQLTNGSGDITKQYSYDVFRVEQNMNASDTNPFRYCGEYYDSENGLIYLRNRYYDSFTGRFTTEDPMQDGVNWYSYCAGNPIMFVDPSGMENETDAKEFGKRSAVYKRLKELGDAYRATDSNSLKNQYHKEAELIRALERAFVDHDLQKYPLGYKYNTVEAVNKIKQYDNQITYVSDSVGVPKDMISSILYREMMCFKIDDQLDMQKVNLLGDASLGIGQIFIQTAQDAEKFFYGAVQYDHDKMAKRLMDEPTNIYYIGLVLKHAANLVNIDIGPGYDYAKVNEVFARYNGTGDDAVTYGRETSEYLLAIYDYYWN